MGFGSGVLGSCGDPEPSQGAAPLEIPAGFEESGVRSQESEGWCRLRRDIWSLNLRDKFSD